MDSILPQISVAIPTKNRWMDVKRCLGSLAKVAYPCWNVALIDQSDDGQTQPIAASFAEVLPNLTYHYMEDTGLAKSRNLALGVTNGAILAFLDDDCTVQPDWLMSVARVFTRYPQADIVFGAVIAVRHDQQQYYIPTYSVKEERAVRGLSALLRDQGLGASMYLRRSSAMDVGPFDAHLGAGAPIFNSSEDWDYAIRALRRGKQIVETPSIVVEHYGTRPYGTGAAARLLRASAHANGALSMKLLRCGDPAALPLIVSLGARYLKCVNLRNIISRQGPVGLGRIGMFVKGLKDSFQIAVDPVNRVFIDRAGLNLDTPSPAGSAAVPNVSRSSRP